jgi:hypothetical protein
MVIGEQLVFFGDNGVSGIEPHVFDLSAFTVEASSVHWNYFDLKSFE